MRITYNDKLNKLLNPYLESLLKEKSSLEPETLTLFDLFMEDLDMGGRYGIFSEILEPRLEEIIREENIESIANLMDGRLNTLFRYMLGDEFAGLFHTYLQLEARCPHTIGYDRARPAFRPSVQSSGPCQRRMATVFKVTRYRIFSGSDLKRRKYTRRYRRIQRLYELFLLAGRTNSAR